MADRTRSVVSAVSTLAVTGMVLARVGVVVTLAMSLFLVAFMGYFVVPFIFVLLALGILGLSGTFRRYAAFTARRRR